MLISAIVCFVKLLDESSALSEIISVILLADVGGGGFGQKKTEVCVAEIEEKSNVTGEAVAVGLRDCPIGTDTSVGVKK